jgi:hypothetical protein
LTPTSFPDVVATVGDLTAEARLIPAKLRTNSRQSVNETEEMCFIVTGDQQQASTATPGHCRDIYADLFQEPHPCKDKHRQRYYARP